MLQDVRGQKSTRFCRNTELAVVDYGHLCLLRGKDSRDQDLQESWGCLACHLRRPENQHLHHILNPARMTIG